MSVFYYNSLTMGAPSKKNAMILDTGKLPSIPQVLLKLIEACHKVDVSFEELSGIIQQDAALSAKIIAVGNSPVYAQWNGIKDFNRLLVVLGVGAIKSIAITSAVHQFFSQFDSDTDRVMRRFWRDSLACAYSAKALAGLTGYESEDEAYLAGLLHKIGQLVLLNQSPKEYTGLLLGSGQDTELDAKERELFGTTGAEVGALLIDNWGLDSFLSDAVLFQREPAESILDTPRLVKLINFAHKLGERSEPQEKLFEEADLLFGLNQPLLEELYEKVDAQVEQSAKAMGIQLDPGRGQDDAAAPMEQAESERVRLELAKQVRNIALLGGVRGTLGDEGDLDSTIQVILQDLNILFSLPRSLCFLLDADSGRLSMAGSNFSSQELQREFSIALEAGRSLVVDALLQGAPLSSYDAAESQTPSVVDYQLVKLLGDGGMLCIPLVSEEQKVGVLVSAVVNERFPELWNHYSLMTYFSGEAARAVRRRYQVTQERQQMLEAEHDQRLSYTRKLVHEANNPLGIINNYLEILSAKLGDDQTTQFQFGILKEEIERVAGILLRMRDLPKSEEQPEGEVDLNGVILDLISIFRSSLFTTHTIKEELKLDDSIPLLISNRNSLKQVLTNLIKNAVEAMPNGGSITIATRGRINVDGKLYVELTIADSGPGIADDILPKLFTPVTSSKGKGHSGLGLTIVKKLITDLQGIISCRSIKNEGTEFRILLPS